MQVAGQIYQEVIILVNVLCWYALMHVFLKKKCIKTRGPLLHVTWACFVKFRNIRDVSREKSLHAALFCNDFS